MKEKSFYRQHFMFSFLMAFITFLLGAIFHHVFIYQSSVNQEVEACSDPSDLIVVNRYAARFRDNKCAKDVPCISYVQNMAESYVKAEDLYTYVLRNQALQVKSFNYTDLQAVNSSKDYSYGSEWIAPGKLAEIVVP